MKKYKTWEAMKMLAENNKLKFKDNTGIIWELIQESVTFEEVLKSDKKCRVEHEYINEIDCKKVEKNITRLLYKEYYNEFLETLNKIKNNNYMYFNEIISILSWVFTADLLKEIIKNGKWYLEV